jgi:hypothetical protein
MIRDKLKGGQTVFRGLVDGGPISTFRTSWDIVLRGGMREGRRGELRSNVRALGTQFSQGQISAGRPGTAEENKAGSPVLLACIYRLPTITISVCRESLT